MRSEAKSAESAGAPEPNGITVGGRGGRTLIPAISLSATLAAACNGRSAICGDGECEVFETSANCPADCADTAMPSEGEEDQRWRCGDGACTAPYEGCANCPEDCCPPGGESEAESEGEGCVCGDGVCDKREMGAECGFCDEDCCMTGDGICVAKCKGPLDCDCPWPKCGGEGEAEGEGDGGVEGESEAESEGAYPSCFDCVDENCFRESEDCLFYSCSSTSDPDAGVTDGALGLSCWESATMCLFEYAGVCTHPCDNARETFSSLMDCAGMMCCPGECNPACP